MAVSATQLVAQSNDAELPEYALVLSHAPGLKRSLRPTLRPATTAPAQNRIKVNAANANKVASTAPGRVSKRPELRPERRKLSGSAVVAASVVRPLAPIKRGNEKRICGKKSIYGHKMSPIRGRLQGCRIPDPVQVTSVDGVFLTTPAIMDCTTAKALDSWVKNGVKPAVNKLGGGPASLQVISHYSCRTVNSVRGGKLSEHGKGHAIDISAINLKNGISLTVLKDWRKRGTNKLMKIMHATACGPFRTVLGPNADRHHQDHFHLDTSRRSSGKSYCR